MSDVFARIANLSPEKRKALEKLLRAQGGMLSQLPISPAKREAAALPLSFAQERLWFLDQLEPNSAVYNIPFGLRLRGVLDVAVLQRCLGEILRRHEPLRTRFESEEGRPVQVIGPVVPLETALINLSGLPEPEREAEARRLCMKEAQRPFDLARDLMLRSKLIRLGEREHILFLNMHHIASDGWSVGLLVRELGTLYEAFIEGKPSPLPELPVQYADFAVWQREWLQGEVLEKQRNYWRKQLAGAPALLELPTDRPRPATQSYRGALVTWELQKPLSVALGQLSRAEGATLFMTLLAAFQTLLRRYSGCEEIPVGSAIAGRNRTEIEPLIGFFVNTLVFRGDLSGNPSFRTLLHQTRDMALGAYDHQDLPFERLVEELHPERDMGHSPFFQVMFVLQNAPWEAAQLAGLEVTPILVHSGTSKFDLTLFVAEREGGLKVMVEYSLDLFDAETIHRVLVHYQTLLEGIVANPDERIGALPLLGPTERHQVLVEWNATQQDCPKNQCLHELFEAQVKRTPEAVAVVFENQKLTYRELNQRANRLAHHLQRLGVGSDKLVGIYVERSLEMVVALLGVLKAGAAYVPIDPAYPGERLAFMLEDAQALVLLTQTQLLKNIPTLKTPVICLDSQRPQLEVESSDNPQSGVTPDNLAYVIYTSGSTGKPKGVLITHHNVVRLFQATDHWFRFNEQDVWTLFHSFAFDFSVWEIWGALLYGGRLVVVPYRISRSPEEFYELLNKARVTVLNQTPSAFRQLMQYGAEAAERRELSLRLVIFGGEALELSSLRSWFDQHGDERPQLVNMYGITETTVHVTYRPLKRSDLTAGSVIGRSIPDLQLYILDRYLQPVPIGVPGEICVGGAGVGCGYLNRPDLTATKFVPNPFSSAPGARLYRSGDLARYLANGDIEYLGRIDQQVKIRGFRIELGEIEEVLRSHSAVRDAAVLAREDQAEDKRLVAYITRRDTSARQSELRNFLGEKLPNYMVPGAFVFLDRLPLTPNGKIDRKALPKPETTGLEPRIELVAPRDPLEQQLVRVWEGILNRTPIGIKDDFFELGGHSLLAVRLFSKIEKLTGNKLPLVTLFEARTIEQLATVLKSEGWHPRWTSLVPIKPDGSKPPFYCVHGVGGNILEFEHFSRYIDKDQPLYGIQAQGLDGKSPRLQTVEEMAAHYIKETREFQPEGPYHLGGSSFGGVVAYEMAQQLMAQDQQIGLLVMFDSFAPGHPKWPPQMSALRRRLNWWRLRFDLHWGNLKAAKGLAKVDYLAAKASRLKNRLQRKLRGARRKVKQSLEESVHPKAIRAVREAGHQAHKGYEAKPYPGEVTLLRAMEQPRGICEDRTNGWGDFALGGVKVHYVPGHHGAIMREPRARILVEKLTACLTEAQARAQAETPSRSTSDDPSREANQAVHRLAARSS